MTTSQKAADTLEKLSSFKEDTSPIEKSSEGELSNIASQIMNAITAAKGKLDENPELKSSLIGGGIGALGGGLVSGSRKGALLGAMLGAPTGLWMHHGSPVPTKWEKLRTVLEKSEPKPQAQPVNNPGTGVA